MISRLRDCCPPPHCLVQGDQSLHTSTVQSTGHGSGLQCLSSFKLSEHGWPPYAACTRTDLVRIVVPLPHVLSQTLQDDQSLILQSIGQGLALHVSSCVRSEGQERPPKAACVITERVLIALPPPHCTVQLDHNDQSDTTQSMGQGWVLQGRYSVTLGQAAPPNAAATRVGRVRFCCPPPHSTEQLPQLPQAPTSHGTGQGCGLQKTVSMRVSGDGQATPPFAARQGFGFCGLGCSFHFHNPLNMLSNFPK
eukprot:TRINITY_DN9450_c0_g1_i4.p2 TRINITY_DN9450_c0_g1~~TRINITY_DN9450_c0_g1_i4.p2  ORF type:complete len:251 (-),score=19.30 TRINITY_DN9450_c0_g1_i4:288-1040(-)